MQLSGYEYFNSSYHQERPWPTSGRQRAARDVAAILARRVEAERTVAGILAAAAAGVTGPDRADDELRASLHESGHALALWKLGRPFEVVAVHGDGGGRVVTTGTGPTWTREAALTVLLAGESAERLAFDRADEHGCGSDAERTAELAVGHPGLVEQVRAEVDAMMLASADAVMHLSAALLARGEIPGADARAILAEHSATGPSERVAEVRAAAPVVGTRRGTITLSYRGVRNIDGRWVGYTFEDVVAPERAYLWPPAAIEAFNAMNAAGDRDDWEAYRRHQDRLADIQRPLLVRSRAA